MQATALFLAVCDVQFPDDETYVDRSLELNRDLLRSPLCYPAGLFPPLLVRCFATAQHAVVEGSGGRDVHVELRGHTSTRADFDIFWS